MFETQWLKKTTTMDEVQKIRHKQVKDHFYARSRLCGGPIKIALSLLLLLLERR
jgi:hypothetical protein